MQIANKVIDKTKFFDKAIFNWIGTHTLEIYVANVLSAVIIRYLIITNEHLVMIISDIFLTVILSVLLWTINSSIQEKLIKHN